jgi:hypothetical protein
MSCRCIVVIVKALRREKREGGWAPLFQSLFRLKMLFLDLDLDRDCLSTSLSSSYLALWILETVSYRDA